MQSTVGRALARQAVSQKANLQIGRIRRGVKPTQIKLAGLQYQFLHRVA